MEFRMAEESLARIRVIGIGGGGGNAVNTMVDNKLRGMVPELTRNEVKKLLLKALRRYAEYSREQIWFLLQLALEVEPEQVGHLSLQKSARRWEHSRLQLLPNPSFLRQRQG
jgi:hypothetical protein